MTLVRGGSPLGSRAPTDAGGRRLVATVELRYESDDEDDGDLLAVSVGTDLEKMLSSCDGPQAERLSGREQMDGGMLFWEDYPPRRTPAWSTCRSRKGTTDVVGLYYGSTITDDPRELDMPISVETGSAIGADPRVDVTSSVEAVKAGDTIDFWDNTED